MIIQNRRLILARKVVIEWRFHVFGSMFLWCKSPHAKKPMAVWECGISVCVPVEARVMIVFI